MGYLFNLAKIQSFRGYTKYITRKVINNLGFFRDISTIVNTQIKEKIITQTEPKSTTYNTTTYTT